MIDTAVRFLPLGERNKKVMVWTDGKRVHGDPRKVKLTQHLSIVVAYGTLSSVPMPLPKHFPFPQGY